jgi:hypothetical protein
LKRRSSQRFVGVWLLLLPAVACSLTLNVNKLSDGCPEGQVDCEGECKISCTTAAGGSSGSSASGGGAGEGASGGKVNGGGTTGATSGNGGAGGEGGTEAPCAISYPFAYEPVVTVSTVHVTGSFIDWTEPGVEMTEGDDGVWRVVVDDMPEGKTVYKFLLDAGLPTFAWKQDPNNPLNESDGFTGKNSILMLQCGVDYLNPGEGGAGGAGGASGGAPAAGAAGAGGG